MNDPYELIREQELKTEKEAKRLKRRTQALIALFCGALAGFFVVLFQLQIVDGESFLPVEVHRTTTETETVDSVRGVLLDRYGRVLISNTVSYHVELDPTQMGGRRNEIIAELLALCKEEGVEWSEALPISSSAPWRYTGENVLRYQTTDEDGKTVYRATELGRLAQKLQWVEDASTDTLTAAELLTAMCETFGLELGDSGPTAADRELCGVLYAVYLRLEEIRYTDYIFASDVDITFISKAKERGLDGVVFELDTGRRYETAYAAHILGRTGAIPSGSQSTYLEQGYPLDATVGLEGVELAFESWLRGTSGTRVTVKDENGAIISQEWRDGAAPEAGSNVALTLDMNLQAAVEDELAQYAATLEEAGGLAAVVVDMTGGVLAIASYPTYDLSSYLSNYTELAQDEGKPLLNRAVMGLYAPGSTFKMCTAIGALSEGAITTRTTVRCTGIYDYFDAHPHCWIYDSVRGNHGLETVTEAIKDSCNIFFYDTGIKLGITKLVEYATAFGLGQYTGIEIPEYKGNVAGPETSAQKNQIWYGGDIMSASIGQQNNQFTPLQLANYVATLVNGGNHYQAHLLKEVKSSDYSRTVFEYEPVLLNTIDIDPAHLAAVKQGMYDLSKSNSMSPYFSDLPVDIGCKTGTAEVSLSTANAIFVCFAPYDDPQIAICLVAEKGASGGSLAQVAAGILRQYFDTVGIVGGTTGENTMIR